jgi:hypothetical protein
MTSFPIAQRPLAFIIHFFLRIRSPSRKPAIETVVKKRRRKRLLDTTANSRGVKIGKEKKRKGKRGREKKEKKKGNNDVVFCCAQNG